MKSSGIGGQAVMEGIMMRNGSEYSVAVRKENGEIEVNEALLTGETDVISSSIYKRNL